MGRRSYSLPREVPKAAHHGSSTVSLVLFLVPTGLADGLGLKEKPYTQPRDSPHDWAPRSLDRNSANDVCSLSCWNHYTTAAYLVKQCLTRVPFTCKIPGAARGLGRTTGGICQRMPTIERSIVIEARVEEVFRFVADYRNTPLYQRQFSRFERVGPVCHGTGLTLDAHGRFKGVPVHARLRVIEFIENQRIVSTSVKGLKSEAVWSFTPMGSATRVTFKATYAWPIPLLSGALRRVLIGELEEAAESSLRELKRLVEGARERVPSGIAAF